jgi:hypothetical protein
VTRQRLDGLCDRHGLAGLMYDSAVVKASIESGVHGGLADEYVLAYALRNVAEAYRRAMDEVVRLTSEQAPTVIVVPGHPETVLVPRCNQSPQGLAGLRCTLRPDHMGCCTHVPSHELGVRVRM